MTTLPFPSSPMRPIRNEVRWRATASRSPTSPGAASRCQHGTTDSVPNANLAPERLRGDARALGKRRQLRPRDLIISDPGADPTIGSGDDVLLADEVRVAHEPLC